MSHKLNLPNEAVLPESLQNSRRDEAREWREWVWLIMTNY